MENMLKVGKCYKLRNGLTTSPIRLANNATSYRFEAEVQEPQHKNPSVLAWLPYGQFLTVGREHKLDIIEEKKKKYLIALPTFPKDKGFNHQTILVSGTDKDDAIDLVYHLKGNRINIGDIKEVSY